MAGYVCPWWMGYFIDNPLRRWIHNPEQILSPYVEPGMTVLDVGCGMGLFSIAMARMVGDRGRVIAVDLQQKMLDKLMQRAEKAGVRHRIELHRCEKHSLALKAKVDFALAFAMVHEVPNQGCLFSEIHSCLQCGGKLLVAEPRLHVSGRSFDAMIVAAENVGFLVCSQPAVRRCRAVVFAKSNA